MWKEYHGPVQEPTANGRANTRRTSTRAGCREEVMRWRGVEARSVRVVCDTCAAHGDIRGPFTETAPTAGLFSCEAVVTVEPGQSMEQKTDTPSDGSHAVCGGATDKTRKL